MNTKRPNDIIDIKELIPDIEVFLAYATKDNFTGDIVPGYFEQIAFLTTQATRAIQAVQSELKQYGMGLKVLDSYRPVRAVTYFQDDWRYQDDDIAVKNRFYPDLTKEEIFKAGYIAIRSTHSRASTIDLTIIDFKTKKELDMGTEFDFFGGLSHTANSKVSREAQKNRLLLKSMMEKNGYINYQHEWWHFRLASEPYFETYFDFPIKLEN